MKSALKALPLLLLSAFASAADLYRVEVLMFAYLDEKSAMSEHWPTSLQEDDVQIIPAVNADDMSADGFVADSVEGLTDEPESTAEPVSNGIPLQDFVKTAERMRYRGDMKVIWHKAWNETIRGSKNAVIHPVEATVEGDMKIELSGNIRLQRSRFIHIVPDLNIQQYILGFPLDEPTDTTSSETMNAADQFQTEEPVWMPLRAAHLTRSRRMRSGEVHYLDHPLLGMLVKVTPYAPAEKSE